MGTGTTAVDPLRARRRTYKGISFGTTLICAGTVLLLNTTGLLGWGVWWSLAKLWPILLISLGLRLIFSYTWAHALCLLGPLLVVLSTFWVATTYNEAAERPSADMTSAATMDLDCPAAAGASSQRLNIDFAAGDLTIASVAAAPASPAPAGAGAAPPLPPGIHGHLRYLGREPRRSCGSGGNLRVSPTQYVDGFFIITPWQDRFRGWEARLSSGAPLDLDIDLAAASSDLDLRSFVIKSLSMDMAASSVALRLGPPAGKVGVRIEGAAASLEVTLPEGTCFTVSRDRILNTLDIEPSSSGLDRGRRVTADACETAGPDGPRYEFRLEMPVSTISVRTEGASV
ncbi:MAG TPA: DUF5668 domain-containing protein [Candidatus Polarisedimenticolia bacterium]|jgi:hypothetical protein